MSRKLVLACLTIFTIITVSLTACSSKQPEKPATSGEAGDVTFFNGKIITFIVGTKPGGGYDTYARLLAPYLQKYLPGSTVVVKNVPGAGHIVAANQVYKAEPDGLTIATVNPGLVYQQLIGAEGIEFDLAKFAWLARMVADARVVVTGTKTPWKDVNDLLTAQKPAKFAASEVGGSDYNDLCILKEALDLKIDIIQGYSGQECELSIMRGETEGYLASWSSARSFVNNGEGRVLLQVAVRPVAELAGVPRALDIVKPEKRKLIELISTVTELSRPIIAPPGLPQERYDALVDALKKAFADPELLAKAEQAGLALDPVFGKELEQMVREALAQPPEVVKTLERIFKPAK